MVLKFYYDLASPPVRAVYFTVKILDIPVELVNINLAEGQLKSEAYMKINPLGTVPCIEDDGFLLLDSHAINIYLTTKYPQGEKLYPSDPKKRAIVNERLFFETCELFGVMKASFKRMFTKGLEALDEETIRCYENGYSGVETYLKKSKYIAGDSLTIADLSVLATLSSMKTFVPINKEKFPLLIAYLERAVSWPFYAEVNEAGHNQLLALWKAKNIAVPNAK